MTVRGERSRYFGPDGSYEARGNGSINNNLNSDFFYRRIIDNGTIEQLLTLPPPRGANAADQGAGARLHVRLQPLPERDRSRQHLRPELPRRGLGEADLRDGRLPALLPARPARQRGRRDRRHRRGAAADGAGHASVGRPAERHDRATQGAVAARRDRQQRDRAGQGRDRQRPRHDARQPALPVGRHRALLPGAAHDPRLVQRRGRRACSACRSS